MTPPLPPEQSLPDPAEITAEDVERARLAWERDAPPEYRNLLDAEPKEPTPNE